MLPSPKSPLLPDGHLILVALDNELPLPNAASNQALSEENSIKNLVTNEEKTTITSNGKSSESMGLEESLLEKIKNN